MLRAGRDGQVEQAMFIINSNGWLEWGPGGTRFPEDDQDILLERSGVDQLTLRDTFIVSLPDVLGGDKQPRIALKNDGGGIHFGPGGTAIPDVAITRPSDGVLDVRPIAGPTVFAVDVVNQKVGVGLTNPSATLEVKVGGTTLADAWTPRSSRRWKENICAIAGALGRVLRLRGVSYSRIEDGKHQIGLVAEEVGEVVPELVDYEENGIDAKSLDYDRLAALLVEALKEQQGQIREMESEVSRLKARLDQRSETAR